MRLRSLFALFFVSSLMIAASPARFTLDQVMSAPFPSELTAAPKGGAVAWVLNEHGARNVWIAGAPTYSGRRLTNYRDDDGQEIAQLTWTPDGRSILFVRGGDFENHGANPNPASLPQGVEQAIWIVPAGSAPRKIAMIPPSRPPATASSSFARTKPGPSALMTLPSPLNSSTLKAKPANFAGRPMATWPHTAYARI
jgi:hypothetical protein